MLQWCQGKNEKLGFRSRIPTHSSYYCRKRKRGEHMQIWNLYPILNMNAISSWFLRDVSQEYSPSFFFFLTPTHDLPKLSRAIYMMLDQFQFHVLCVLKLIHQILKFAESIKPPWCYQIWLGRYQGDMGVMVGEALTSRKCKLLTNHSVNV